VRITGRTTAVARAQLSESPDSGVIQIDGTIRSNCGASLDEPVTATLIESAQAVAVRLTPVLSGGAAPIVPPPRGPQDPIGVPVLTGAALRLPTFAKAVNYQVVRTIPSGPVVIGARTDIRIVEGEQTPASAPAVSYEDIGGLEREVARVRELVELPLKHTRL